MKTEKWHDETNYEHASGHHVCWGCLAAFRVSGRIDSLVYFGASSTLQTTAFFVVQIRFAYSLREFRRYRLQDENGWCRGASRWCQKQFWASRCTASVSRSCRGMVSPVLRSPSRAGKSIHISYKLFFILLFCTVLVGDAGLPICVPRRQMDIAIVASDPLLERPLRTRAETRGFELISTALIGALSFIAAPLSAPYIVGLCVARACGFLW